VALFFITVNQVLVRLWARDTRMSDRMLRRPASEANAFRGDCYVLSKSDSALRGNLLN
jgi:hypothetical protein